MIEDCFASVIDCSSRSLLILFLQLCQSVLDIFDIFTSSIF